MLPHEVIQLIGKTGEPMMLEVEKGLSGSLPMLLVTEILFTMKIPLLSQAE